MGELDYSEIKHGEDAVLKAALKKLEHPQTAHNSDRSYKYWFIFNPAANKGRAEKKLKWLSEGLKKYGCDTVIQMTTLPKEASRFASIAKARVEVIIACGGDGTLNEVIQPLAGSETIVGCLPFGSANDFLKNFTLEIDPQRHLSSLFKSLIKKVDLGKVTYNTNNTSQSRYFLNSFGLGFSGRIAKVAGELTWAKGDLSYLMALMKVASDFEAQRLSCRLHTPEGIIEIDEDVYMLSVGNGKTEAGKFKIAPNAKIDDGLLDVCLLKNISRKELPKWIGKYYKGTQIKESEVIYAQVSKLEIDLPKTEVLHLDGEVLDKVQDRLVIEVCPASLNMLTSNEQI
jgi:YegS/Rv2252/BmrU family lipid kinase